MNRKNRVAIIGEGEIISGINKETINKGVQYSKIDELDNKKYLPGISIRCIDNITISSGIASSIAIGNYISNGLINPSDIGVVLGSALGSIVSISEFDLQALREGPSSVNPMEFPNTVSNAPASKVGIWFKLKGSSVTISNGLTSSIDAIGFAFDEISNENASYYIAGGSEQISENVFEGYKSVLRGKAEISNIENQYEIIGEGSSVFFLTSMNEAVKKDLNIQGEITDYFSSNIITDKNYFSNVKNIITALIDNNKMDIREVLICTSHLPFNCYSNLVCNELVKHFDTDRIIISNKFESVYKNYLGINGVVSLKESLKLIKEKNDSVKGSVVFDIGCDGKFSGVFVKC